MMRADAAVNAENASAPLRTARIRVPIAPMHAEPRVASPQISQQLAGHLVDVLVSEGDWVRATGVDGYPGWMHAGYLVPIPPHTTRRSQGAPWVSLGCTTEGVDETRRSLPLRAMLSHDERVVDGEAMDPLQISRRFPPSGAAIAMTARRYFGGTSYQWGGVTPWGADCSGMVQAVFALHGIPLPRDAWQQAEHGATMRGALSDVQAGDLLFFSDREDRRVTHVGIAAGPNRLMHLSLGRGGFAIERFDDSGDAVTAALRARFLFTKRLV